MENVKSLLLASKTGSVSVGYYGGKRTDFGIVDLLWRFVGFDGRGFGVRYTGAYRSGRDLKRDQKVDGIYRSLEEDREEVGKTVQRFRSDS